MMTFLQGNLLDDDAQALVNPVNCVGVSGAGLARQFAKKFPWFVKPYQHDCRIHFLRIGAVTIYGVRDAVSPKVICFPTKLHWADYSRIEYIEDGLKSLVVRMEPYCFKSIAIPRLGCGLGGLEWSDVRPLILEAFRDSKCDVRLYGEAPDGQKIWNDL